MKGNRLGAFLVHHSHRARRRRPRTPGRSRACCAWTVRDRVPEWLGIALAEQRQEGPPDDAPRRAPTSPRYAALPALPLGAAEPTLLLTATPLAVVLALKSLSAGSWVAAEEPEARARAEALARAEAARR